MTKEEYMDHYYTTDNYFLSDLIEQVWNDACNEMREEVNKLFIIDAENLSDGEMKVFYKTIEKVKSLKVTLK